jgi:hypothetical protein
MSGEFLGVAHASRVLASASSPGGNGDFDSPAHRRQAPEANGPAEYLCAFFCWLRSLRREILKRTAVSLHTKKLGGDS